jgi:hypothetical protein
MLGCRCALPPPQPPAQIIKITGFFLPDRKNASARTSHKSRDSAPEVGPIHHLVQLNLTNLRPSARVVTGIIKDFAGHSQMRIGSFFGCVVVRTRTQPSSSRQAIYSGGNWERVRGRRAKLAESFPDIVQLPLRVFRAPTPSAPAQYLHAAALRYAL